MRSIMLTYPGFQSLPQGLKKLLVASETFFFDEAQPQAQPPGRAVAPAPPWTAPYDTDRPNRWPPALGPTWRN